MCVHVTKRACDVCMDTDRHADNVAAVLLVRAEKLRGGRGIMQSVIYVHY